jgi:hypothetical protein
LLYRRAHRHTWNQYHSNFSLFTSSLLEAKKIER